MARVWKKTLVYLGLAEDDEDLEGYGYDDAHGDESAGEPRRPLRRLQDHHEPSRSHREAVVRAIPTPVAKLHRVSPRTFNDAQEIGDKFREGHAVVVNFESTEQDVAKRVMDFASGLVYGLGGHIEPAGNKVVILAPRGMEVSAEEGRRLLEESGFFNQA